MIKNEFGKLTFVESEFKKWLSKYIQEIPDGYMSPKECAEYWKKSLVWVYELIKSGKVETIEVGTHRKKYVNEKQFKEYVKNELQFLEDYQFSNSNIRDNGKKNELEYRPFRDCDELLSVWDKCNEFYDHKKLKNTLPLIWVRNKNSDSKMLLTGFGLFQDEPCVCLGVWISMVELFNDYTFLDGTICGVKDIKK